MHIRGCGPATRRRADGRTNAAAASRADFISRAAAPYVLGPRDRTRRHRARRAFEIARDSSGRRVSRRGGTTRPRERRVRDDVAALARDMLPGLLFLRLALIFAVRRSELIN